MMRGEFGTEKDGSLGAWGGKKYEGLGMRDVNILFNLVIQHLQETSKQELLPAINAKMIQIRDFIFINKLIKYKSLIFKYKHTNNNKKLMN